MLTRNLSMLCLVGNVIDRLSRPKIADQLLATVDLIRAESVGSGRSTHVTFPGGGRGFW